MIHPPFSIDERIVCVRDHSDGIRTGEIYHVCSLELSQKKDYYFISTYENGGSQGQDYFVKYAPFVKEIKDLMMKIRFAERNNL